MNSMIRVCALIYLAEHMSGLLQKTLNLCSHPGMVDAISFNKVDRESGAPTK
jgi:hypothetical protein